MQSPLCQEMDVSGRRDQRVSAPAAPPSLSALARRRLEQESFAATRLRNYIARPREYKRLDACAQGRGLPLAVSGEAGSGKSALLANWQKGFRASSPHVTVLAHFLGASRDAARPEGLLLGLVEELAAISGLSMEKGWAWSHFAVVFAKQLEAAAAKGPLLLILDGLEQLGEEYNAQELAWLPKELPANVRLIVAARAGGALQSWSGRGWPVVGRESLAVEERRQLVTAYLLRRGGLFSAATLERLTAAAGSANPLYLTTLLGELLALGDPERLGERLDCYLGAADATELFDLILQRLEQDCDGVRPGLTGEALALIAAAHGGLSETELRDCLGTPEKALPAASWSPLAVALGESLQEGAGRLAFSHEELRAVVERRYLATPARRQATHRRLADYFAQSEDGGRRLEEWPRQLFACGAWSELAACVGTPEVFAALVEEIRVLELDRYWSELELGHDMVGVCAATLARLDEEGSASARLAGFSLMIGRYLFRLGQFAEVEQWLQDTGRYFAQAGEDYPLMHADLLRYLGSAHMDAGRAVEAERVFSQALVILDQLQGRDCSLGAVVRNLRAEVCRGRGNLLQAMADYQWALTHLENTPGSDPLHLAAVRSNLAGVLLQTGDFDEAENLCRKALFATEGVLGPRHPETADAINELAAILVHAGRAAEAEPLHGRALTILERTIGPDHLVTLAAKSSLANALRHLERNKEAEALTREVLASRERIQGADHPEVLTTRHALAVLLAARGAFVAAEDLYRETLPALEAAFGRNHHATADCAYDLARLYHSLGRSAEADPYHLRAIAAFVATLGESHLRTLDARGNYAYQLANRGAVDEAAALFRQALQRMEWERKTDNQTYANCVNGYGLVLRKQGQSAEAEKTILQALELYEKLLGSAHAQIGISLKTLADLYVEENRLVEAEISLARALAILEKKYGTDHPQTQAMAREPLARVRAMMAEARTPGPPVLMQ